MSNTKENNKNWFLALLLSIVCLDRLYLGQTKSGVVKVSVIPIIFLIYFLNVYHLMYFRTPSAPLIFAFYLSLIVFCYFAYRYVSDIVRIIIHRENLSRVMTSSKAKSNKSTSKERMSNAEENN